MQNDSNSKLAYFRCQKMKIQPALRYTQHNEWGWLMSLSIGHVYIDLCCSPIPLALQVLKLQPPIKQPAGGEKSSYLYLITEGKLLEG